MDKIIIKFNSTAIEKYKFYQHKSPISINNIDINEIVTPNKVALSKKDFRYLITNKNAKKIDLYAYSFQK